MKALRNGEYDEKIVALVGVVQAPEGEWTADEVSASAGSGDAATIDPSVLDPSAEQPPTPAKVGEATEEILPQLTMPPQPIVPAAAATMAFAEAAPTPEVEPALSRISTQEVRIGGLADLPAGEPVGDPERSVQVDEASSMADTQPILPPSDGGLGPVPSERLGPSSREVAPAAQPAASASGATPAAPPVPTLPSLEVSVTERPYGGQPEEVTERVDMRETLREGARKPAPRPPSASVSPLRRSPSQAVPPRTPSPVPRRVPGPTTVPGSTGRHVPVSPPRTQSPPTPMPALPRISRTALPAIVPQQPTSDEAAYVVDRPASDDVAGDEAAAPMVTPTFYSQQRRRTRPSEEEDVILTPGPLRPQASRLFGKPVPGAPQTLPPVDERTPVGPLHARRSGVYPIPGLGGPGPERPHPDPHVRAATRPATTTSYGSTPQRYTAPSRIASPAVGKRRSPTGAYERPGWNRGGTPPPAGRQQAQPPRPGVNTEPRVSPPGVSPGVPPGPSVEAHPGKLRQPAGPGLKPLPRVGRSPDGEPAPAVVARPAVMVGEQRPPRTDRPASPSLEPPRGPTRPRGEVAVPAPSAATRPSAAPPGQKAALPSPGPGKPPPAPPAPPPAGSRPPAPGSMFGAGLITERSLDEVILSYLAEDVEADE